MKLKHDVKGLTLVPSRGGCFEVTVNGKKLHSKLQSGQFPDPDALVKSIRAMR